MVEKASKALHAATASSLEGLPNEVICNTLFHLSATTQVCLALTSHQFYDLVLQQTQKAKLSELVLRKRGGETISVGRGCRKFYTKRRKVDSDLQDLMRLLEHWMPTSYRLCREQKDAYVSVKIKGDVIYKGMCSRCEQYTLRYRVRACAWI